MDAERARQVLHLALRLHVLEPEDVQAGGGRADPCALLREVEAGPLLPSRVRDALDRLAESTIEPARARDAAAVPAPLDLGRLDEQARTALREAALLRALTGRGVAPAERLFAAFEDAREADGPFERLVVEQGVVEADVVAEARDAVAQPREVCPECLARVPDGHPPGAPCAACEGCANTTVGFQTGSGTSGWTAAGDSTEVDWDDSGDTRMEATDADCGDTRPPPGHRGKGGGRATAMGVQGFPGAGGTFASYELLERVAEGGMGVVFRARETSLNRVVAMKVMRGGALASKNRRRRFLREAESAAALDHANIVPIHKIDEVAGYPYYTMDFVEGRTLDAWVLAVRPEPRQIAEIMRTVCDAVHHFHLRGIIHRDLKPDNILVTEEGVPKIIDFGIAKKVSSDYDSDANWTVEGDVFGTPHYMPPEQASGRINEVDARSDVYALGAILYELLTGAPPFHGLPIARVTLAVQEDDPVPIGQLNEEVEKDLVAICQKGMAKERERRYQSSLEFAEDLERYVDYRPVHAQPATFTYRARKWIRRRRGAVAVASVIVVAAAIALGLKLDHDRQLRLQVEHLIAEAGDPTRSLDERSDLLKEALVLDPANAAADAKLSELKTLEELARAEEQRELDLRIAEEKARAELARAEEQRKADLAIAEEKRKADLAIAEAESRAAKAREQAREDAAVRARRAAEDRARALLAQADAAATPLEAFGSLADALVVIGAEASDLRRELEGRKLGVALDLANEALDRNQVGLVEFWLREANKVEEKRAHAETIGRIEAGLARLTSGQRLHEEAQALIRAGDWLAARAKLDQAQRLGVAADRVGPDLQIVTARCAEITQQNLDEGRALLQEGRAALGLARAREAQRFAPPGALAAAASALFEECAESAAREASVEAHRLFQEPESRRRALALLSETERALDGSAAATALGRERQQRARLLSDPALAGLAYVPAVAELEVEPFYIRKWEVTNREFKAFVDRGGYADASLFDPPARRLLPRFVDATPGSQRLPGPRCWRRGGYGDASNADRPVRGVTWYEARAYARWLSRTTGATWRLPTAREWEAAAGWDPDARRLRTYPWGEASEPAALLCNHELPQRTGRSSVDRSAYGVFDTGGNVSEWVQTAGASETPLLKGASFTSDPVVAGHLSKVRVSGTPGPTPPLSLTTSIGFRLVRACDASGEE